MSSNNNYANPWFLLGAAVVGLVSAASVFIYEQFRNDKPRQCHNHDVARLDRQLLSLREELENIKQIQKARANQALQSKPHRKRIKSSSVLSTTSDDFTSAAGDFVSSDEEFYDLSSDDEQTVDKESIAKEISEIDANIEDENTQNLLLDRLSKLNVKNPKNAEILWRLGRVLKYKIIATKNADEKRILIDQGINYLEMALELNQNSAQSHKWLAILIGLRGDLQPTKERILDGHLFREHIEKSLAIEPNDPVSHHLLGRFYFEIANLSWLEKKVAATLFAELPTCTYDDALSQFLQAENMNANDWKENRLFIAKCKLGKCDIPSAVEWLNKAECATNKEEENVHREVRDLLEKHNIES